MNKKATSIVLSSPLEGEQEQRGFPRNPLLFREGTMPPHRLARKGRFSPWRGVAKFISVCVAASLLTACGVKRPLIAPKDIPAYEAKRAKRMEQYKTDGITAEDPSTEEEE